MSLEFSIEEIEEFEKRYFFGKSNIHIAENPLDLEWSWNEMNQVVKKLCFFPYQEQLSPEWKRIRTYECFISASTIACITDGSNPYKTENELFLEKTNQKPPDLLNDAMIHGILNEDLAATMYAKEKKKVLFKFGIIPHSTYKFLGASVDRVTLDGRNVEIKTPLYSTVYLDEDLEFVLRKYKYYWHQIQMQAFITGLPITDFVRYGIPPNENHYEREVLSIVEVPTDYTWWETYKNNILSFAEKVISYRKENPNWDKKKWPESEENERRLKEILSKNKK